MIFPAFKAMPMLFMFLFSLGPTIHYSSMMDWDELLDDSALDGDAVFQEESPQYDCLDLSGTYTCSDSTSRKVEIRQTGTSSGYTFSILPFELELKNSDPDLMFGNFVADGGIKLRPHSFRPDIQYAAQCNEENLVTVMHNDKRGNGVVLKYGWSIPEELLDIHINFFQYLSPNSIPHKIDGYASTPGQTVISCHRYTTPLPEHYSEEEKKLIHRVNVLAKQERKGGSTGGRGYSPELKTIVCSLLFEHKLDPHELTSVLSVSVDYIKKIQKCEP